MCIRDRYGMLRKNGQPLALFAEMFNYESAHAMINALLDLEPINDVVKERTYRRMLDEYSELADPKQRNLVALEALHNKARAKFIATELRFLSKAMQPVRYQVAEYLDSVLTDQTLEPGQKEEFYGVDILYNTNTATGFGSIISKFFRSTSYSSFGGGLYPSGTPIISEATNVAFDDNHIYAVRTRDLNLSGNLGSEAVVYEACINRSQYWTYIPAFGYGVYDENGDRVTTEFIGQTTNSSGNTISFQWTDVSGEGDFYLVTPTACRSLKDGQVPVSYTHLTLPTKRIV